MLRRTAGVHFLVEIRFGDVVEADTRHFGLRGRPSDSPNSFPSACGRHPGRGNPGAHPEADAAVPAWSIHDANRR